MFTILKQLKHKLFLKLIGARTITIGELASNTVINDVEIFDNTTSQLKFIEQGSPQSTFVLTPTGFSPIKHIHKTVPYRVWEIKLASGKSIKCADDHIVIANDGAEVFAKDCTIGTILSTIDGDDVVVKLTETEHIENMYDLELSDQNHIYYTNGILSHNSETSCAYLFWFSIFNDDKTVLITSNKHKNATEMISRIKYMYEHLPDFLKPSVTEDGWNKLSLKFETGSRIISDATSETTGRGGSFSILFGDETAFVSKPIQEEFWASISPTLATGGKMFLTSTPNGDSDLFATLWRGAVAGTNGFVPMTISWDQVPGRDESFRQKEIAKNGILKWQQEFECLRGDHTVTIQDENGKQVTISLENLYLQLEQKTDE